MQWLCSFIALFFISTSFGQEEELSFIFVGDVMQHDGQIEAAFNKTTGTYEYEDGFKFVKPVLNQYDIRVANLEVTLAGKPFKGYPQFSAPDDLAKTLINTGFNIILTANNHSCDRGSKGVIRTLDQLDALGVLHTGTFRSQDERDSTYPLILEEKGMRIAMLNYTYGTNGLTVNAPLIINYIDSAVIKKDVERAKELNADYIICNMHWGSEYKFLPNKYQKRFESYCYDLGVDMVIGGHPHTVQPIVKKEREGHQKLTVWSLGNFVSNMQTRPTRGGVMVSTSIKNEGDHISIGTTKHHLIYVLKKKEGTVTQYYILPDFDYNTYRPGFLNTEDQKRYKLFFDDSRKLYAEHNIEVEEANIDPTDIIGKLYQKYLTEYYSVQLETPDFELLRHPNLGEYLHMTVDPAGKQFLLSGVCETVSQANGVKHFIEDCNLNTAVRIVRVTPKGIEKVVE